MATFTDSVRSFLGFQPSHPTLALSHVPEHEVITPEVIHTRQSGVGGTSILAGRIANEEYNRALENEEGYGDWSQAGTYDFMRRSDPDVKGQLTARKLPILGADPVLEPADESPLAMEIADFVSWCMFDLICWASHLRQGLLMYDLGFVLFEVLHGVKEPPQGRFPNLPMLDSGKQLAVVFRDLAPRMPRTVYRWEALDDDETKVKRVIQLVGASDNHRSGLHTIWRENLLRYTLDQEAGNFQGVSALRAAHKPWKIKEALELVDSIRHERMNCGIFDVELPEGHTEADEKKAEKIAAAIGSHEKSYIVRPHGMTAEWNTSGQGKGTEVGEAIERNRRAIADSLMTGFLTLGNGDTGSYALAETQADMFLLQVEGDAGLIEDIWNRGLDGVSHIRKLVELNYGVEAARDLTPQLRFKNLRSRDFSQILPLVLQAMSTGAITDDGEIENFVREKLGLKPRQRVESVQNGQA